MSAKKPLVIAARSALRAAPASVQKKPIARAPKARPADLVRRAVVLRQQIDRDFYQLGLVLRELAQPDVYNKLGHDTFEALLDARELGSRQQARRLIKIVESMNEPTARQLGIEKAYAVVRYTEQAHAHRTIPQVLAIDPLVRHEQKQIPLSRISARALDAAVSALRAAAVVQPPVPRARYKKASQSLSQLLRHAGVDPERVKTKNRLGKLPIIRIELSLEEAEDLIALVRSRK